MTQTRITTARIAARLRPLLALGLAALVGLLAAAHEQQASATTKRDILDCRKMCSAEGRDAERQCLRGGGSSIECAQWREEVESACHVLKCSLR